MYKDQFMMVLSCINSINFRGNIALPSACFLFFFWSVGGGGVESEGKENKDVNRYRFKCRFKDSAIFIIHEMTKSNGLASEDRECSVFLTLNPQNFLL